MENVSESQKKRSRGRPSEVDQRKLALVLKVLAENPDGLWLRKIAKKASLHPTTVSNYVDKVLRPLVDDISLGSDEKPIMRVIRLKPSVINRLGEGATLRQLLQLSQVIKDVGQASAK